MVLFSWVKNCPKKMEDKPRWECPPFLEPTKSSNENFLSSFANGAVVTEDVQQVGSTDYAIPIRIVIPTVREAPVITEHIQNVRCRNKAVVVDVPRTRGVVLRLVETLREVLIWDANRSSDGLADRSVEVEAVCRSSMVAGSDGVAPENRLSGNLSGEQPAPGEQHGKE